ncbi:hypothetical protein GCM10018952_07840 [Streptosporangium vulgare]
MRFRQDLRELGAAQAVRNVEVERAVAEPELLGRCLAASKDARCDEVTGLEKYVTCSCLPSSEAAGNGQSSAPPSDTR